MGSGYWIINDTSVLISTATKMPWRSLDSSRNFTFHFSILFSFSWPSPSRTHRSLKCQLRARCSGALAYVYKSVVLITNITKGRTLIFQILRQTQIPLCTYYFSFLLQSNIVGMSSLLADLIRIIFTATFLADHKKNQNSIFKNLPSFKKIKKEIKSLSFFS